MMLKSARFVLLSKNAKIGRASATYLPFESCDDSCPFKGAGCYACDLRPGIVPADCGRRPVDIARDEQGAIKDAVSSRRFPKGRPLRSGVSGDARTSPAAKVRGETASIWRAGGGGSVWAYTHSWRSIPRTAWGQDLSILASVETATDGARALARGYAPALVVDRFPGKAWEDQGVTWHACPAQLRADVTCERCTLCFKGDSLAKRGHGVAFEVHGSAVGKRQAIRTLTKKSKNVE